MLRKLLNFLIKKKMMLEGIEKLKHICGLKNQILESKENYY